MISHFQWYPESSFLWQCHICLITKAISALNKHLHELKFSIIRQIQPRISQASLRERLTNRISSKYTCYNHRRFSGMFESKIEVQYLKKQPHVPVFMSLKDVQSFSRKLVQNDIKRFIMQIVDLYYKTERTTKSLFISCVQENGFIRCFLVRAADVPQLPFNCIYTLPGLLVHGCISPYFLSWSWLETENVSMCLKVT